MGEVVLVKDRNLKNAEIVLKFLHSARTMDEQQFLRFQNEALLMRELNHPHIVHVYDFGVIEDKMHYLSMEYIQGQSLGQLIREHPEGFDFKKSLEILYQIALALAFAHGKGIVHRDLKPDNILLDLDGEVRLTDFGLGKSMEADFSLTDTGQAVGTPHYMSPEQLRGEPAAPHSDIYSFGLLAFELVTGKKAYDADSYLGLAEKHIKDPIPVFTGKQSKIPAWFQDFIEKCSAKSAQKRFGSCGEIAEIIASNIPSTKRTIELEPHVFGSSPSLQHWRVKWRYGKPKQVFQIILIFSLMVSVTAILLAGRNNHDIRIHYGKYYFMLEAAFGFKSKFLRNVFVGDNFLELDMEESDLYFAVERSRTEDMEFLLGAGLDPNLRTADGQTLVQMAVSRGLARSAEVLAEYGADFTVEDENRRNLVVLATIADRAEVVASIVPSIPEINFKINQEDSFKKTALHYAIEQSNVAIVELLIQYGAAVHLRDGEGNTPLMYAAKSNSIEIFNRILKQLGSAGNFSGGSASINLKNKFGYTALHFASEVGFAQAVEVLLTYNADPDIKTSREGYTAIELAQKNGHTEVVSLLKGISTN